MEDNHEFINYFKDKLKDITAMNNSFLQMPNMICFNFCLKEILDLCDVNSETGNKKYYDLAKDFLEFLRKDIVLKKLDLGVYINIVKKLGETISNRDKVNYKELFYFFDHIRKIHGYKYRKLLYSILVDYIENGDDYRTLDCLIETFINELLSKGYTYKYLNEIVKKYLYEDAFESPKDFLDYLFNKKENYDIYIPLLNFEEQDKKFFKKSFKNQDIELGKDIKVEEKNLLPDIYYCHVYFSGNDYFYAINKQIKRLKSLLNLEKFYAGSKIDFDWNEKCIIKANRYMEINDKTLKEMLLYDYYRGSDKIIDSSIASFKKLTGYDINNKEESKVAKDFFNIIDYSEKDNNVLSIELFINKWIALETLYSKSPVKSGFDSVLHHLPTFLAIDCFRRQLGITIKRAKTNIKGIEEFILACYGDTGIIDLYIENSNSIYYKKKLYEYKEIILKPNKLKEKLDSIIEQIKMNLYRIYMIRNRFVHTGETKAFYDISQYLLCQILAISIDKFMKTINDLDKMDAKDITWNIIFNNLTNKYNTIYNGLTILVEGYKANNKFILKRR